MPNDWILLIDPFQNLLNAYRVILEDQGYFVEAAMSLKESSEKLSLRPYSVVITEYFSPFEETYLMIRQAKQMHPETSIIMVTNTAIDDTSYEKLFDAGLEDIILKPYSPEKILVHVKKGIRRRGLMLGKEELKKETDSKSPRRGAPDLNLEPVYFKKCLRQELKRTRRHNHPLSLLLFEIPNGPILGDRSDSFCAELAGTFRRQIREEDTIGRDNGHIGILLPETDQVGSQAVMIRLSTLAQSHPAFLSDKTLKSFIQTLPIRSFTYPERFIVPQSLRTVVDEVSKEYPRR